VWWSYHHASIGSSLFVFVVVVVVVVVVGLPSVLEPIPRVCRIGPAIKY